ncbi:hypothetical protein OIU77_009278 [Salix suchowensis]|uniref:Uncharacterized protein n=1 Tax=Salix suchowensis TaxID=1278906 RepID=A0ABQ9ADS0_9ROSI|nr:hypothetical protein OIU77_009278 [Salix suchowensis]
MDVDRLRNRRRNNTAHELNSPNWPTKNHDEREFLTPKCGVLAAEIEEHDGDEPVVMAEEVEIPKPAKKEEKRKRRPRRKRSKRKMPPLNDGMAMKEHLRSWASAVAWTLR